MKQYMASLFSAAGFGDTGFQRAGIVPVLFSEIDPVRTALLAVNFPDARIHTSDIVVDHPLIAEHILRALGERNEERLFLLSATPPCQGMSKNGIGTLLKSTQRGIRPQADPRNRLYLWRRETKDR